MKKIIATILLGTMVFSAAGCASNTKKTEETSVATTTTAKAEQHKYATTVDALNAIWSSYDGGFPVYGGSIENPVDGAAGAIDVTDKDLLKNTLLIPDGMNVTEAATLIHMMNGNTFTAYMMKIEEMDDAEIGEALTKSFTSTQFMCGVPERINIGRFDGYIVVVYGAGELIDAFTRAAFEVQLKNEINNGSVTITDAYYPN